MRSRIGPEVCLSNRQIRKMLRLAKASKSDTFYDLGCGRSQLCILAVVEFGVRRAVGIESHKGRAEKARSYVEKLGLSRRIEVRTENFYDSDLSAATVVYNGLMENDGDLEFFETNLGKGVRLVTLALPLVGVMPNTQDYPFYLMKTPFEKPRTVSDWISAVLSKKSTLKEFFSEIGNDRDYWNDKITLKRLMRERLGFRGAL